MGVLLMVPPEMVRASTTLVLVMQSVQVILTPALKVALELLKVAAPLKVEALETKSWEVLAVFVTPRVVEVALVDVKFVKTPVDGVEAPMVVPLIPPPVIVTFGDRKFVMVDDAPPARNWDEI